MESTIFEILEQHGFEVMVVNARDVKHVLGRKTDVSDAQWLQRLHEYGLLRASFRPQAEIAGLRAYLRQRERLLDYAAAHIQHMQKALTQMNLHLPYVVSDVTGVTGMSIIRAIVAGEHDPSCSHRERGCHASVKTMCQALVGQLLRGAYLRPDPSARTLRRLSDESDGLRRANSGHPDATEAARHASRQQAASHPAKDSSPSQWAGV
jgi:Transposase